VFAIIDFSMVAFVRNTMHLAFAKGLAMPSPVKTMPGLGRRFDQDRGAAERYGFLNGSPAEQIGGLLRSKDFGARDRCRDGIAVDIADYRYGITGDRPCSAPFRRSHFSVFLRLMEQPKNGIIPNR